MPPERGHHFNLRFSKISYFLGGDTPPKPSPFVSVCDRCHQRATPDFKNLSSGEGIPPNSPPCVSSHNISSESHMPPEGTISTPDSKKSFGSWEGTPLPNPPLCICVCHTIVFKTRVLVRLLDATRRHCLNTRF